MSLSARRAWIEIQGCQVGGKCCCVALRKESVDRNTTATMIRIGFVQSLSARRAWIEIMGLTHNGQHGQCRSPQGERG